jgi:hypothetical protein
MGDVTKTSLYLFLLKFDIGELHSKCRGNADLQTHKFIRMSTFQKTINAVNLILAKCDMNDVYVSLIGHFDFSYGDRLQYFLVVALIRQLPMNMKFRYDNGFINI